VIELICQQCGNHYFRFPYKAENSKYCSLGCFHKSRIGRPLSQAWKLKISASLLGNIPAFKGKHHSAEAKAKLAKAHIGKDYLTERGRQIISQSSTDRVVSEETRRIMSSKTKAWRAGIKSDPEQLARFTARLQLARHTKPTKPERYLNNILEKYFPYYKYNGDGRLGVTLGGLTPDFVNVNGQKEVIEVFGDYWHGKRARTWRETELGRIMAFNSLGFHCLIIWEHELKELGEEDIVMKIKDFSGMKRIATEEK